jgi:hypothetical protein
MEPSQDTDDHTPLAAEQAHRTITEADTKLARYSAALEDRTDPTLIATWTAEVTAAKATAQATLHRLEGIHRMTQHEITTTVTAAGNILDVLRHADGRDKADIYGQLGCV